MSQSLLGMFEELSVMKNRSCYHIGLKQLKDKYVFEALKFNDVSCVSIAITGVAKVDGTWFQKSLKALAEKWLDKQWPANGSLIEVWTNSGDVPDEARNEDVWEEAHLSDEDDLLPHK